MKKWLAEHKVFSIISAIVIVLCIIIIASFLTSGTTGPAGEAIQSGVAKVEKPLSSVTAAIKGFFTGHFNVSHLQAENEQLKERIAELEKENTELTLQAAELKELQALSKSFNFKPFSSDGKAVAGRIIEFDGSDPYVVFTIDVGTEAGIKEGNPVVTGEGLVGCVQSTGEGYSKVVSILSTKNKVSFKVLRDTSVNGIVQGGTASCISGYVLNYNAHVIKGDTLITSGVGAFPEGIKIGTVDDVQYNEEEQIKTIKVVPVTNFEAMQKVAVYYQY